MTHSRRLAVLIGPTLVALATCERVNAYIWASAPATQTYLAGCLWFVAGLSIIRVPYPQCKAFLSRSGSS
jgi:hypothetical protein